MAPRPGAAPVKSEAALRVATPLLEAPVAAGATGRSPGCARDRQAGRRPRRPSQLSKALHKKVPLAAAAPHAERTPRAPPRSTGRSAPAIPQATGRGRRYRIVYGDESEALTHPYLARAWAKAGAACGCRRRGRRRRSPCSVRSITFTRQLIVHTSPTKRSSDCITHLERLDRLHRPKPGRPMKPMVLVEDNGPSMRASSRWRRYHPHPPAHRSGCPILRPN